ncbi:MgtC/SapB family protein [Methylomonas sp. MED-D]|uniref:MgtC/SapB family protein n=1 Tax=unclassified Methylomonas TaxID=2608980 RepID=UPI0028A55D70|nr:MgtC/SapB family protein [Methylomonas sp. MV1]MDT4332893.1 MgtC/SapB family protein [Methylomonas sp. MV1]
MNPISPDILLSYWSTPQIEVNVVILMNIVGALLLGMVVGYERSFHGRAAGMRTYGLVCMASAALTIIVGYPHYWFGGLQPLTPAADPTRVIQGIVTGIGFLGAGVIMKEGLNISGLTTAASIWASSAIGILCGSGFYFAAIVLTLIASVTMIWGGHIENILPSRHSASVQLTFRPGQIPSEQQVRELAAGLGYRIADGATAIVHDGEHTEWHLVFIATSERPVSIPALSAGLQASSLVAGHKVAFARN